MKAQNSVRTLMAVSLAVLCVPTEVRARLGFESASNGDVAALFVDVVAAK